MERLDFHGSRYSGIASLYSLDDKKRCTTDKLYTQRIFQVLWQMKKDGYSEATIETIGKRLKTLSKHVNLYNPDEVKTYVANAGWSNGYKDNMVNAYNHFAVFHGLQWKKPTYLREITSPRPFIVSLARDYQSSKTKEEGKELQHQGGICMNRYAPPTLRSNSP